MQYRVVGASASYDICLRSYGHAPRADKIDARQRCVSERRTTQSAPTTLHHRGNTSEWTTEAAQNTRKDWLEAGRCFTNGVRPTLQHYVRGLTTHVAGRWRHNSNRSEQTHYSAQRSYFHRDTNTDSAGQTVAGTREGHCPQPRSTALEFLAIPQRNQPAGVCVDVEKLPLQSMLAARPTPGSVTGRAVIQNADTVDIPGSQTTSEGGEAARVEDQCSTVRELEV